MESETRIKESKITAIRKAKGHDVFIDGEFSFWVTGSRAVAMAEAKKELQK